MHTNDIGQSFDKLKRWMKENRKPSDRTGMTYQHWKWIVLSIIEKHSSYPFSPTDEQLRPLFGQGVFPYAAFKKLEKHESILQI